MQSCDGPPGGVSTTKKDEMVITSLAFGPKPTVVEKTCSAVWSQACYHYSSAIAANLQWDTLKCVHGNVRESRNQTSRGGEVVRCSPHKLEKPSG